jgi:hypothetical protein
MIVAVMGGVLAYTTDVSTFEGRNTAWEAKPPYIITGCSPIDDKPVD